MIENIDNLSSASNEIIQVANHALALDSSVVEAKITLSELYYALNDDVNALRYTYESLADKSLDSLSTMKLIDRLSSVYMRIGDSEQALYLINELLKLNAHNEDVLQKKIITLAAEHQVSQLKKLKEDLQQQLPASWLIHLINFHLALEKKNMDELVAVYQNTKTLEADKADWFKQYGAILAFSLKKKAMKAEAQSALDILQTRHGREPLYKAQIELYNGNKSKALELLANETVGWYNLNLSQVNPLMADVNQTSEFKSFIEKNKTRLLNLQERVHQLELRGYLPKPYLMVETVLAESTSGI
jgi:lipopolysaccharide biosynthesis regulator YciM